MNSSLNEKGFRFTKALSVAALAGLTTLLGQASYSADVVPTLGDDAAYTIHSSSESDYNFRVIENGESNFYKLDVNTNNLSSNTGIIYNEVSAKTNNSIEVNLFDTDTRYYKYTVNNSVPNYANNQKVVSGLGRGGVLENPSQSTINANFINNSLTTTDSRNAVQGGAVAINNSEVKNVVGDFVNNYTSATCNSTGGAIWAYQSSLDSISGNYIGNYNIAKTSSGGSEGGALMLEYSSVKSIEGLFINNGSIASASDAGGGAIKYYYGSSNSIKGDFIGNYLRAQKQVYGSAIAMGYTTVKSIEGDFINNHGEGACGIGGAIAVYGNSSSYSSLNYLKGNFIGNYVKANSTYAHGGALYLRDIRAINQSVIESNFYANHVEAKGDALGGALYNATTPKLINASFVDNYAKSTNSKALAGAIYSTNNVILQADNKTNYITGNYIEDKNGTRPEAIYMASSSATLDVDTQNGGQYVIDDQINGTRGYKVAFTGDGSGNVYLNNNILGMANVSLSDATLNLSARDDVLNGNNLVLNSGTLNMINNQVGVSALNSLTVNGDTNLVADVDLASLTMDRFTADNYGVHTGNLNVVGMNILSDTQAKSAEIYFAQPGLKDNVVSTVGDLPEASQTTVYSPIYKYKVRYENRDDAGYFVFDRASSSNPADNFNPSVLVSPVTMQAAAQSTLNQTFNYVFEHADTFTAMPNIERMARINSNSVALSTDYNQNLGVIDLDHANKGVWVRPYSAFENLPLKHGPKVDVISYGTFVGFDSEIHRLKHGWANVGTAYLGYNGSQMKYGNVDSTMNGGLLGLTETFYKGNFFTALTATAGAGVTDTDTMYGHEDGTFLMGGIGSKTGYNFEFKGGKFIIQPIMFMSYSIVKGFDYTNAAGVRINSEPSHTVQLNPSVRFIGNIEGWQPYASVGMVWDILHESNTKANGVKLPEMYTKPYVQYGLGLQRCWDDKFSAFGQAMIRNGGRNGISLTFGFRWALGKGSETVKTVTPKTVKAKTNKTIKTTQTTTQGKKVLKQLSPSKRAKLQNTTRTSMNAVIK